MSEREETALRACFLGPRLPVDMREPVLYFQKGTEMGGGQREPSVWGPFALYTQTIPSL